ncbi:hypothetical protein LR090_02065 [Candidatus Bipolaricaulota bacterium]|nr:hypothetical protein [Candidatus Bipolaricaulota bacterium]
MKRLLLFVAALGVGFVAWGLQISQIEFDLVVEQGQVYSLTFLVRNDAERAQTITVYLGDWDRDIDGTNRFYPPGTVERSLASWLSLPFTQLTLGPEEAAEVTVEMAVPSPEETTLAGTYWGIIFVQGEPRPMEQAGTTVMAIERFGVKVYATIAGTELSQGRVTKLEVDPAEEGYQVVVYYENTGNVHHRVIGTLEVIDRTGAVVQELELGEFPILPGSVRRVVATLPQLARGIYQLRAVMDYGGEALVAGVTVLRVRS